MSISAQGFCRLRKLELSSKLDELRIQEEAMPSLMELHVIYPGRPTKMVIPDRLRAGTRSHRHGNKYQCFSSYSDGKQRWKQRIFHSGKSKTTSLKISSLPPALGISFVKFRGKLTGIKGFVLSGHSKVYFLRLARNSQLLVNGRPYAIMEFRCEPLLCFLSTPDRITGPSVFPLSLLLGDLDTAHRQAPPIHLFNRLGNNCLAHLRKSTSRNTSLPY
ncbi:unnamed protein product [Microthlaspi erraticum]|uniref:Uncharacterized protein n=1 Tax=Microthlaspi erraticum TaxID=1685480 RepID=A0A6D2K129_9BRAS|nr:unnamed protein product [Microthlaspi erraticum]